jgi:DNA-binding winged helix-turn-helix (wHTH) protein/Tol biopolymer transport system component
MTTLYEYAIFLTLTLFLIISMRWKIEQFVFCDQQQTLTSKTKTQQLEPMVVELLSYFCQNTDQIISKDQLIEQVWLGRIVTDNAISRTITKLRKIFADDVRQPKFIATFPKKGYKFIAPVKPIIEDSVSPEKPTQNLSESTQFQTNQFNSTDDLKDTDSVNVKPILTKAKPVLWLAVVLLVLVNLDLSWLLPSTNDKQPILFHAKALTRDAGNEFAPSVSPDGSRVAYMSMHNDQLSLLVKNITDERSIEINHGDEAGVGPASWSSDGKSLVYLVATPELCQYYIRTIEGLELGEPRLIHNCPAGSYGKILFTHDNNRLVFAQSKGANTAYSLFEMNLTTEKKILLPQPPIFLGGNSQFDLHPTDNKLLISSPDEQQWEGFFSLDLDSEELTLLFKQDAYTCCGIWSHDGKRVVLMGEYPAYQLLSYDLSGRDMQIIYSGAHKLNHPNRHINGIDYLFSSDQINMDINLIDLDSKQNHIIANATVDDRLAVFAHQTDKIAYVSLTTGHEEIWITDSNGNQRSKLTTFADSRHYLELQWSPNDKLLMALTLNEIHIIDSQTGTFKRLKIPQTEIRGLSFKDEKTIAYSVKIDEQWRVHHYQLTNNTVRMIDSKWQYIRYAADPENTIWLDQKNTLYWGKEQKLVEDKVLLSQSEKLLYGRVFNLQKHHQQWLWFDHNTERALMRYSPLTGNIERIVETNMAVFDIKNKQVVYNQLKRVNSDIYITQGVATNP